jgi:hypothetical protein
MILHNSIISGERSESALSDFVMRFYRKGLKMDTEYDGNGNEIIIEEVPMFQQFKRGRCIFLAIKTDNGIRVIDINGNNYGGFYDLKSFDRMYKNGEVASLGDAVLRVVLI